MTSSQFHRITFSHCQHTAKPSHPKVEEPTLYMGCVAGSPCDKDHPDPLDSRHLLQCVQYANPFLLPPECNNKSGCMQEIAACSQHHTEVSLVSDWSPNLSFWSTMAAVAQLAQPAPLAHSAYWPSHTYIALIASDGDSLQVCSQALFCPRVGRLHPLSGSVHLLLVASGHLACFGCLYGVDPCPTHCPCHTALVHLATQSPLFATQEIMLLLSCADHMC